MNSKSSLQSALLSAGITELTDTQARIMSEGRTHYNSLIQGRPNDGQTLGLVILMLQLLDAAKNSTQGLIVTATREAAELTTNEANKLSKEMGIRFGLATFDSNNDVLANDQVHCLIGTPAAITKCVGSDNLGLRMIFFDDGNKSMSYDNHLLKYGAKYVALSSYVTKKMAMCCTNELKAIQLTRAANTIVSKNLRHIQFVCDSQSQKLDACVGLSKWPNAKRIVIFVTVKTQSKFADFSSIFLFHFLLSNKNPFLLI